MTDLGTRATATDRFMFRELHSPWRIPLLCASLFALAVLVGSLVVGLPWLAVLIALAFVAVVGAVMMLVARSSRRWAIPDIYEVDLEEYATLRRALRTSRARIEVPADPRVRDIAIRTVHKVLTVMVRLRPWAVGLGVVLIAGNTVLLVLGELSGLWQILVWAGYLVFFLWYPRHLRKLLRVLQPER